MIEDPNSELTSESEASDLFTYLIEDDIWTFKVARVQRGGLLADKVMAELPPVRHRDMGRPK